MGNTLNLEQGLEAIRIDDDMDFDDDDVFMIPNVGIQIVNQRSHHSTGMKAHHGGARRNVYQTISNILTKGKLLGEGSFGKVYKGILFGKEEVAIKEVSGTATVNDLKKEGKIMSKIDHKNIVKFIQAWTDLKEFVIVMEYLRNGDLRNYIMKNDISPRMRKTFATDVAEGMQYLEERNIVHRDLAARNVLLDIDLTAKVADFGLARYLGTDCPAYQSKSRIFPLLWTAPEGFDGTFSSKSDVWSFGILLMEIVTDGDVPYSEMKFHNEKEIYAKLKSGVRQKKASSCSDDLYQLMKSCWEFKPSKRPDFSQIFCELESLRTKRF